MIFKFVKDCSLLLNPRGYSHFDLYTIRDRKADKNGIFFSSWLGGIYGVPRLWCQKGEQKKNYDYDYWTKRARKKSYLYVLKSLSLTMIAILFLSPTMIAILFHYIICSTKSCLFTSNIVAIILQSALYVPCIIVDTPSFV